MNEINHCLQTLRAGEPKTCHNLSMIPLQTESVDAAYLMLEDAIAEGLTRVEEVSESGSVPHLRLLNDADQPVFLLDGEEVTGAKQNRILNVSVLADAEAETIIPVSCVEQGRWQHTSREFQASDRVLHSEARVAKYRTVSNSMKLRASRSGAQSQIWNDIAYKSSRMGARSSTGAAEAMYTQRRRELSKFVEALKPGETQTGAAFVIDGKLVGLELFDAASTLKKALPKLVRSYALDAMDQDALERFDASDARVEDLVIEILNADQGRYPGVGLGEDVRLESPRVVGGALVHDNRVVHLCAYRVRSEEDGGRLVHDRMRRASNRMRSRRAMIRNSEANRGAGEPADE